MKAFSSSVTYLLIFLLSFTLTSCELAGDIFAGGFYAGIIAVLVLIGLVIWGIRKMFGGNK